MIVTPPEPPPMSLASPQILLAGTIDETLYRGFREQISSAADADPLVLQLTILGGDPEIARAIGEDIRLAKAANGGRRYIFVGKTAVYSAGVTLMSFFPRQDRYLTSDCRLMIHERQLEKTLDLHGPMTACMASAKALVREIENAIAIQNEGFENLIRGSGVTWERLVEQARENWYLEALEARSLGLVAAVV
jgi:ATP-dependent protease ClpP protease subunit